MSVITDIKQAKGNKKRVHIYIDDEFVCSVDDFTAFKNKLHKGREITKAELENIVTESEQNSGFERVVDLISRTPKTQHQVRTYLKEKGYMPKTINVILAKLQDYHYLDDRRYAEIYIENNISRYGKRKIMQNLLMRGVDKDLINECLADYDNQDETVLNFALKFMKNREPTRENFDKLCRHLAGKGFDWSEISLVISKLKEGNLDESWD